MADRCRRITERSKGMSKKGMGKLVVFATIAGAAAAGISYLTRYHSFNKELDEDFHDFEDEEDGPVPDSTMNRNYVSLHANKDELLTAAGDMLSAAKDVAGAAKNVMKDAAAIVADTTREAVSAASDSARTVISEKEETVGGALRQMKDNVMCRFSDAVEDMETGENTDTAEDAGTTGSSVQVREEISGAGQDPATPELAVKDEDADDIEEADPKITATVVREAIEPATIITEEE